MYSLEPDIFQLGPIVLFGSGETSPQGRKVFEYILRSIPSPPRIALLETPAGFELNSDSVIGRIRNFIDHHLQNYDPQICIIPARRRGTYYSPDNPKILTPLLSADLIFMGPGSPTYAVRQLRDSLAWEISIARHRSGSALIFASAATIAISSCALPVYEIYKVGEDLHWKEGLNFFGLYGLSLVLIPHWNNNDGGSDLDTSYCFMGASRFTKLMRMLPPGTTVIGIDELTALIIEPEIGECSVIGNGSVTLLNIDHLHTEDTKYRRKWSSYLNGVIGEQKVLTRTFEEGDTFDLDEIGTFQKNNTEVSISKESWAQMFAEYQIREYDVLEKVEKPPKKVAKLVEERDEARSRNDWETADKIRDNIAALGWKVIDTPEGPELIKPSE